MTRNLKFKTVISVELVESHSSLSYFRKILSDTLKAEIQNGSALTLFLPQDSAWDSLQDVERLYLESEFSDDDVRQVINMHAVKKGEKEKRPVRWSDTWANGTKCELFLRSRLSKRGIDFHVI